MTSANNAILLTIAIVTIAAMTSGCAGNLENTESDFGNSVRAMNRAQTIDLSKVVAPDTTPIDATDGQRMDIALQTYRESVGNPAKITDSRIQLDIDE
jgi:hypothetical protein